MKAVQKRNRFSFNNDNDEQIVVVMGDNHVTAKEAQEYLKEAQKQTRQKISSVDVRVNDNNADLIVNYKNGEKFLRVRRITGYLASLDSFNNAKREEVKERVRHA